MVTSMVQGSCRFHFVFNRKFPMSCIQFTYVLWPMIHWVSFIHRASFSAWKSFWSYFAQFAFPLLKHGFFHQASPGWWPWPHPLSSKLIMVMNTGNRLKCQKWSPYKCRTAVSMPLIKRREMVQPMPTIRCFYRQPRQPPCARHVMTLPTHPPLSHSFASAKPIFKTDCTDW